MDTGAFETAAMAARWIEALGDCADREEAVKIAAREGARAFGNVCLVATPAPRGAPRAAAASPGKERDEAASALTALLASGALPPCVAHAIESGITLLWGPRAARPELPEDADPELFASLARLGIRSCLAMPLHVRERALGALAFFTFGDEPPLVEAHREAARDLAAPLALALENVALREDARRASALNEAGLGIVAHELRQPITAILIATRDLCRGAFPLAAEKATPRLQAIERAARRMERLLSDLLDVTRAACGRFTLARQTLPATEPLQEAVETLHGQINEAGLALRTEIAGRLGHLSGDRQRLVQVLGNLLGNAVKFTPHGGRVTVGARRADGEIHYWVEDSGPGIAAEQLPRVFEPFWQASPGDRRGAGLGLAIAKGIVDSHGGRIWAETRPGAGSTFFVALPAQPDLGAPLPPR